MNLQAVERITRARSSAVAMHGVYEVTKLLAAAPRPGTMLPDVLSLLCNFFELGDAAIALCDADRGLMLIGSSPAPCEPGPRMSALLKAALRHAAAYSGAWVVESEWAEPSLQDAVQLAPDSELDLSFVSVPIQSRGRVQGVLGIERAHSPGDQAVFCFDADVRLLTVIANVIAASASANATELSSDAQALAGHPATPAAAQDCADYGAHIIGKSAVWLATMNRARAAAKSLTTVLLRGESGTGKEVLARYLHDASLRADKPFVPLNCAALSETMLESELFGHEKGAFTGAITRRKGRFELADGGTLFLDEIGEISPAFQARLLRVLQLGEFERVGGMTTLSVNVRVIAATHRNLEQDVRNGRFRADLYYRISVVPLVVPALRDHPSDIPALAHEFLRRFNANNGTNLRFDPGAVATLLAYDFPGNIRELENSVCRAATLTSGPLLRAEDFAWLEDASALPCRSSEPVTLDRSQNTADTAMHLEDNPAAGPIDGIDLDEDDAARARLLAAMERAGWVQAKAARMLGLTPRQIAYALRRLGITIRKF